MSHALHGTPRIDAATLPAAAVVPRSAARVEVLVDRAAFAAIEVEWDALVERTDDQPFYHHAFVRLWLEHFGHGNSLRVLTLREATGRLTAALPLLHRRARLHGLPIRELCSAANLHSCRSDLIADQPAVAARAFLERLRQQRDWDVLRLLDVPSGGNANALLDAADALGLAAGSWPSLQSPCIALPGKVGAEAAFGSAKFRANLRRRRRRLQEKGPVTIECIDGGPALQRQLEDGLLLEASGWKGSAGTAIAQDPDTLGFYLALARHASARGMLRLWMLRLDGRAIAFHFALEHRGRYLLLKPAYDESIAECSPGQLLLQDVLDDCVRRGLQAFDFLGPDMPWKRDWTGQTRPHAWLFVFRGVYGRLLGVLKFRLRPQTKGLARRWTA